MPLLTMDFVTPLRPDAFDTTCSPAKLVAARRPTTIRYALERQRFCIANTRYRPSKAPLPKLKLRSRRRNVMKHFCGLFAAWLVLLIATSVAPPIAEAAEGWVTWAVHVSLVPTWFDPAETSGILSQFLILYALHDAMVKPMPGQPMAPGLAESWTASADGLVYDFVLRRGVTFHNGDPVTAEDVKFSFERYRGISHKPLKEGVAAVETPDPRRVRFRLKRPWPDFMTFYANATGANWIVAKSTSRRSAMRGSRRHRSGPGPIGSSPSRQGRSSSWRRSISTGARPRT